MDPHSFVAGGGGEVARRCLGIAEKLLMDRDLVGSKAFATRARDADLSVLEHADQILAVVDTLLVAERRVGDNAPDWYAVLQLGRLTQDSELIASQYWRLALLLNPHKNRLPFADHAFQLVSEAWSVLSNTNKKSMYDSQIIFSQQMNQVQQQQHLFNLFPQMNAVGSASEQERPDHEFHELPNQQLQQQQQQQRHFLLQYNSLGAGHEHAQPQPGAVNQQLQLQPQAVPQHQQSQDEHPQQEVPQEPENNSAPMNHTETNIHGREEEETETNACSGSMSSRFWTMCPFCYNIYEYPRIYEDCTLRCQNCKRAFQAVKIPSVPPMFDGQESFFCCWGFYPLGISMSKLSGSKDKSSSWNPFSPMSIAP